MASNLKGWIGFLVVTVIIIGGAFGTSHILPSQKTGAQITGISASGANGFYDANNTTYVLNVTSTTVTANFTVGISSTVVSGPLNISVVPPSIENMSAYNATFTALYNKIYNASVNATVNSGVTLNSTINASLAANATSLAATYANQNLTYNLFTPVFKDVTYTGGKYSFNLTLSFNATALSILAPGQTLYAMINAATGAYSANGFLQFTKT